MVGLEYCGFQMAEMLEKMRLYFEAGAEEVWLCAQQGKMYFFASAGQQSESSLCPECPLTIK